MVNIVEEAGSRHESPLTGPLAVLPVIVLAFTLTACSGSSSSSGSGPVSRPDGGSPPEEPPPEEPPPEEPPPEEQPPAPSLSLSASPDRVPSNGSATLSWSATNADRCDASGAWSGSRGLSGTETVGSIDENSVFRLSCSGEGGGVSREVTVTVAEDADLSVSLAANPERIGENDATTLSWNASGARSCVASGGWSGSRPVSGAIETGPLAQTTTFSLACRNGSENALASVTVEVLDKMIRWQAPTRNEDGTPLNDLAGYVVYWGTQSREYIGSYTIDSPSTTEWEADIAPNTYYFALTAFDAQGNESDYSNELRKLIP